MAPFKKVRKSSLRCLNGLRYYPWVRSPVVVKNIGKYGSEGALTTELTKNKDADQSKVLLKGQLI